MKQYAYCEANMKVLFLNGNNQNSSLDNFISSLSKILENRKCSVSELKLRDMKFSPCRGCFNCWVKTPGVCVFKDDGDLICREFIHADLVILASPIIMGYPSAIAKNALDRVIPLIHPYLEDIAGEVHHMKRYDSYPELALLLEKMEDTDDEDIEIIRDIFQRSALNLQSKLKFLKLTTSSIEEVANAIINN